MLPPIKTRRKLFKKPTLLIAALLLLSPCLLPEVLGQVKGRKPNILILLADDLGWKDLSCYGSTYYQTPHLDSLAANGIQFTQGYAASPVCSPTRASLLTGKYPTKTGVTDWIKGRQENGKAKPFEKLIADSTAWQLALNEKTIAEYALEHSYATFFAGKWHLGETEEYWPEQQGFKTNKGGWAKGSPTGRINDTTGGFFTPYRNPRLPDGPPGEYLTDRLTDECLEFIEANQENTFLLFYSLYAVHNPLQAPRHLVKKYQAINASSRNGETGRFMTNESWMRNEKDWKTRIIQDNPVYAAMIGNMDWNIGRIITMLREKGLLDNTIILFTSDNGGLSTAEGSPTSNLPLRAGKGWLYEGGIRVPLILYWKNMIKPGLVSDIPVNSIDIYPTIAKAISRGFRSPKELDGTDMIKMLSKPADYMNRDLIWHYPHYSNQGGKPGAAIRSGHYKLIYHFEEDQIELFDLAVDPGEQHNIAGRNRQIAMKMKRKLSGWLQRNNRGSFRPNPGYIPGKEAGKTIAGH